MEGAMADRWLSVEETAGYLGVSRDTVCAWIARKAFRPTRWGGLGSSRPTRSTSEWVRSGKASEESDSAAGP